MSDILYLLWSNKHDAWWKAGGWGYTPDITEAGRFTEPDVVRNVLQSALHGDKAKATLAVAAPENWAEPVPPTTAAFDRVFAARMKRERIVRGMRQEDLARALANAGLDLHPSAIAKIERESDPEKGIAPRAVHIGEAVVIAAVLGLTVPQMLMDEPESTPAVVDHPEAGHGPRIDHADGSR